MNRHPDPMLLQSFVSIVETGSFTSAARCIHRTQSAISMQIRRLEESLDCRLFERVGRTMRLTQSGEAYFDYARRILRLYDQAAIRLNTTSMSGEVTIGAPDDYARTLLPGILQHVTERFPSLHVTILCEPSRHLEGLVNEGSLDVALMTEGEVMGGGTVLHREELAWATSAVHDVHKADPVPLAIFHSGDVFRREAILRLEEYGRRSRIVVSSVNFAGIDAALEAGIAIAPIFRRNLRPGLRALTPAEGFPELPSVGMVLRRSERSTHANLDQLVDIVIAGFRQAPRSAS